MKFGSAPNFQQVSVVGFRPEVSSTAPVNPVVGQQWTDTSVVPAKVRWYDGISSWVAADGSSIPAGHITDAMVSNTAAISLNKLATNPVARANHTGTQLASTISDFNSAVRTNRLDQFAAPTATVDLNGVRLTNVAPPVAGTDAANRSYVDNARAGISVKDPVRVVAQGNVNLASPGGTIDGVAIALGDRFLAPRQTSGFENGIYTWNGPATPATRSPDADATGEIFDGSMVAVSEGTDAGKQYIQNATPTGVPGAWQQNWIVFSMGGQTYLAGTGLTLSGTTFALDAPVAVNLGGTGATTPLAARTNIGAVGKYAVDLGALNTGIAYTITHNLGSLDVIAVFRTIVDGRVVEFDWAPASTTVITVNPDVSYASGAVRVVVIG